MNQFLPRSSWIRAALVGAAVLCIFVAGLMAVSPELHEHLHHDAGAADHSCLVTILADGGFESTALAVLLVVVSMAWTGMLAVMNGQWVMPMFLDGGVLEHGPPVVA